jgi:hypothetical protein
LKVFLQYQKIVGIHRERVEETKSLMRKLWDVTQILVNRMRFIGYVPSCMIWFIPDTGLSIRNLNSVVTS